MVIKIKDKEIELKQSIRSMIIYENIMGETFQPSSLSNILVYFYATVIASEKGLVLEYEDFLDIIDENPLILTDFSSWLTSANNTTEKLKKDLPSKTKGAKKVKA